MEKLDLSFEAALALVLGIFYICNVVSTKTKAKIPALLMAAFIFLIGYWTIFPLDLVERSGIPGVYALAIVSVMVNIGTLFDLQQLKQDWRVVVVTLLGIAAMGIVVFLVVMPIFGREVALVAIPPIAGGGIAVTLMSDAANAAGKPELAVLAVMILVMQGFVGMPLMSTCLRKEATRLVKDYRTGIVVGGSVKLASGSGAEGTVPKKALRDLVPAKYKNGNYYLFTLFLVVFFSAAIASVTSEMTNGMIGSTIIAVILGAVLYGLGILDKDPYTKSGINTFMMTAISINILGQLNQATLDVFLDNLLPLGTTLIVAGIAVLVVSGATGRFFGYSPYLAVAIASNMFLGFPKNNIITDEVVNSVGETPEEVEYLRGVLLPKIILGGIVSVSIASVIIAGLFASLL